MSDETNKTPDAPVGPVGETEQDLVDAATQLAHGTDLFLSPYTSGFALRVLASVVARQICLRCRGSALNILEMQSDLQRWVTWDVVATVKAGGPAPTPEPEQEPQAETSDEVVPAGVSIN